MSHLSVQDSVLWRWLENTDYDTMRELKLRWET